MGKVLKARCPKCDYPVRVPSDRPSACGRCSSLLVVRDRPVAPARVPVRTASMPVKQKLVLTGRQDFDKLVASGYLPPPTPEMAADLQRRGVVVRKHYPLRVGDLIGKVAHVLGIPVCAGCSKRRTWLNTHLPRVSVLVRGLIWMVLLGGVTLGVFKLVL